MLQSTEYTTAEIECKVETDPTTYTEGCPAACKEAFNLVSPLQPHTHQANEKSTTASILCLGCTFALQPLSPA